MKIHALPKLRLAWLADAEDADTHSARETRVLLRGLARRPDIVRLWFAVGSTEPPHLRNGIRVFPVPTECLHSSEFLRTLMGQQRPDLVLSNLPRSVFPADREYLEQNGVPWLDRLDPADHQPGVGQEPPAATRSIHHLLLVRSKGEQALPAGSVTLPYLWGMESALADGQDATTVLERLRGVLAEAWHSSPHHNQGASNRRRSGACLVMRQQLFSNASLAHVMFELTNALMELGVLAVPQEEHAFLSKTYVQPEEALLRAGAPEKYQRLIEALRRNYDPERAITSHFSILKSSRYARFGVFRSLSGREVLYTTGNHTVDPSGVRQLMENFEMILAPSRHVLRPYIEAGLSHNRGAVIPHGVDPAVFCPSAPPLRYTAQKGFRFLQTSFPWIYEKGFDLSVRAFGRAFSDHDDVVLILRVPRIMDGAQRASTFGRLEALVREEAARPGAPEILLIEQDVELNHRGGIYTGADCYLFPLRAEGFAMTILEAMACGLPVIATPWSGPVDFLSPRYTYTLRHSNLIAERGKGGAVLRYHVEPDFDHLVYLMRYVYEHREEAKDLGQVASKVALTQWTWEQAAAKLASLFSLLPEELPAPEAAVPA